MTLLLQRITTRYSDVQDRIRLAGELDDGQTMVLWLTQRLLNRVIPLLCQKLEQQEGGTPLAEVKQEFAQQRARADLAPQPAVQTAAHTQRVLVHSVDLKPLRTGMGLQFKNADGNVVASLQLHAKPLRQWLNIVYDQYLRAGWPSNVWPAWVAEAKPAHGKGPGAPVLH